MQFSGECIGRAVDSFVASLESVIASRGQPLVVRVGRETMEKLDLLVQGGVCKSRSEAALYLLERGAESAGEKLEQIAQVNDQIERMRDDLADWVQTSEASSG
jgi:hypothetical protein